MANHSESCLVLGRPGQNPEINASVGFSLACCEEVEYTEQANSYLLWLLLWYLWWQVEIESHKGLSWARSIQKENILAPSCSLSCFLLTPSTEPYMETRSVDTSLPILKGLHFFFLNNFLLLLLLVTWFFSCTLRDERSSHFHLFFSPAQKFSLVAFYAFQFLGKNLGLLSVFILTFFSLLFQPFPSGGPGLLASKVFFGFWCIYFNLAVFVAQQQCHFSCGTFTTISLLWVGLQPRERPRTRQKGCFWLIQTLCGRWASSKKF